jgi:RHS repeat-associated protein
MVARVTAQISKFLPRLPAPLSLSPLFTTHHSLSTSRRVPTPFLLITYMQPQQFHALTHSFAQRRAAIPFTLKRLRTLSIATGVYPFPQARPSRLDTNSADAIYNDTRTTYYHGDHLGSARLLSTYLGAPVWSATYLPFGQEWNPQMTPNHYKFTGDERDGETGLDHAQFRQYSSQFGRWASPDPAGLAAVDPSNPQSWNRYAYALNNPLKYIDPTGLYCLWDDGTFDDAPADGGIDQGGCGSAGGTWIDEPSAPNTVDVVTADPLPPVGTGVAQFASDFINSFNSIDPNQLAIQLNQCAAARSNKAYSKVLGQNKVANAVLGNTFSSLSQLALGPGRTQAAISTAVSGPGDYNLVNLAVQGVGQAVGNIPVTMGTSIGAVPGSEIELGGQLRWATQIERYVAQRVKDLPAFGNVMGKVSNFFDGKLLLDGATYLGAEASCGF